MQETLSSGSRKDTTTVRTEHEIGRFNPSMEYELENIDDERTQTAAAKLRAQITKRMSASTEQQVTLEGEENNQTTLGLETKVTDKVKVSASHTMGNRGNSSLLDLRREDTKGSIYLSERIDDEANTTIVGADRRITSWSKAYGQHEITSSIDGQTNRKILGLDNTWKVGKGTTLDLDYEHSHIKGEDKDTTREAGAVGIEYLKQDKMKTSLRVEGRRDVGDEEKIQAIVTSCFDARLTEAFSILAGFNWSETTNLTTEMIEAKLQELNLGLALRPTRYDWLNFLAKYTNTRDQRPITLTGEDPYEIIVDTYSLEAVLDLTERWHLVEKVANRLRREISEARGETRSETHLWINRLNYHIHHKWDAALEYRLLRQIQADDIRSGFLVMLYRHIVENLRFGIGYNFTDFKDLQFDENGYSAKGWFVRLQGRL